MVKILIWGTGKYVNNAFDSIELDKCKLLGLIDNNIDVIEYILTNDDIENLREEFIEKQKEIKFE